ncbi:hypothetical protein CL647_02315 [bacterium]|nr:hypothetical protein [Actinomycetota bacterium]MBE32950.1 hypothetical protein [bacterium]|tara:strand:- start:465 stop:1205 length:741 start_codon:yes stop_codon:yes gene_type:complete
MREKKTFLIDIGNSFCEYCELNSNDDYSNRESIPTELLTHDYVTSIFLDSTCYISSVVPDKDDLFKNVENVNSHFANHNLVTDISINLSSPDELGADRLINALGAFSVYGGPSLIVDSGTAITFCFVSEEGVYEGGAIFPGMRLCSWALNRQTAKLPLVWVESRDDLYGKNTKDAIEVGLYQSFYGLIDHMIGQYRSKYKNIKIIGTGKGLSVFKKELSFDYIDNNLIFHGLKQFAYTNHVVDSAL